MIEITYWRRIKSSPRIIYEVIQDGVGYDPFYKEHMVEQGWKRISKTEYYNRGRQMALEI